MKKSVFLGVFVAGVVLFGSCGGNKQQQYVEEDDNSTSMEDKEVTDRTIYGICTAGTAMNTLEMITDSGDTLKLNISRANAYNLLHREDFPTLHIGQRMLVSRDKLVQWMDGQSNAQ